jgi:hypothetical protein
MQLEGRAKVSLGVISAVLAAILLKAADARTVAETLKIPWSWLLWDALFMTLALLGTLWSLRLRKYDNPNDGIELMERYEQHWPDEQRFTKERMVDYAVASSGNRKRNLAMARSLTLASFFMFLGILVLGVIVCIAIRRAL